MSFSQEVKNEIVRRRPPRPCCAAAAAYAVACFGKYFDARGVVLQTESEATADFARRVYGRCGIAGTITRKERPAGPVFEFSVKEPAQVQKLLALFGRTGSEPAVRIDPAMLKCQGCVQAFVGTAFLCCGTANDPDKGYSVEFATARGPLSRQLEGLLAEQELHPHRTRRRGVNIVYVKAGDQIEDLLTFMGAGGAAMQVMDRRAYRGVRNKTNRLSNCETANLGKSVQAAVQVQRAIRALQAADALGTLPPPLQTAARLRMQYPGLTLAELAQKFDPPVSKAGLSHRFKRIQELAARLPQPPATTTEEQTHA